jgi:hypothetical protein
MTQPIASSASSDPSTASREPGIVSYSLALLADLESSLRASHQAILARDVSRLEQLTEQQASFQTRLQTSVSASTDSSVEHLRPAQSRVLHLARVQRGLLDRMQRRLNMLSNLTAGAQADYRPGPANTVISVRTNLPASHTSSSNPSASMEA